MEPERQLILKQLETYSNAIVGFAVLQAIAYGHSFGTSELFNCLVHTASFLAEGLTALFIVVMGMMLGALGYCRAASRRIAGEYSALIDRVYLGKMAAVVIFTLMPLSLTVWYGIYSPSHAAAAGTGDRPSTTSGKAADKLVLCNKAMAPASGAENRTRD